MKIQKLTLEGFRGFKDKTEFELHPNVNVFVGVNGSGKTSVLDAVGMTSHSFMSGISGGRPNYVPIYYPSEMDVNRQAENHLIKLEIQDLNPNTKDSLSYKLRLKDGIVLSLTAAWRNFFESVKKNKKLSIPLVRYFKLKSDIEKPSNVGAWVSHSDERTEIYKTAFNLNTDFDTFANWYINEENDENRVKVETKDLEYSNPKLKPVREAINSFFTKMDASSLSNLIGDVRGTNGKLSPLAIKKNGIKLNINQLSSGEKQAILYVADIASRLSIANPKLENTNEGEGVVLIDEIDAHLHPAWQRDIIPALTHVFPNVQFLVTTHSPQVLSNVKKESVHMIENFKRVPFTPSTFGADSNMILWDIFGVKERPKHLQERLSEYYRALEKKNKDEVLKILEKIEEDYGADRLDIRQARMDFQFEYDEYFPKA